ncbi:MAG: DUF5684 domain-containing protein [Lacibacter sp.]
MDDSGVIQLLFIFGLIALIIAVPIILGMWKTFQKAGRQGWECIIPIYNYMVMAEIGGKPNWWGLLCLIPYAGIVFQIWITNLTAKKFGKSEGFTVGLVLLPFIFWPILGFGDAVYEDNALENEIDLIGTSNQQ